MSGVARLRRTALSCAFCLGACFTGRGAHAPLDATVRSNPCALAGSIQYGRDGVVVVPGAAPAVDLSFLQLPTGFCAHYYATVPNARQLRVAPGGELFVASPSTGTPGGGPNGLAAIVVAADDDGDGVADAVVPFLSELPSTQGIAFSAGSFLYQDDTRILRVPYAAGDRAPRGSPELLADVTVYRSLVHWPKAIDVADDGTIFVGNGGDQEENCDPARPFHGGILRIDGTPGGTPVARGLRNPIAVRCARGHDRCFSLELGRDFSADAGGDEKLLAIHDGDDWGFPCCARPFVPFPDMVDAGSSLCDGVAAEADSFVIGDTPFGIDFETGLWPSPWTGNALVAMHGQAGTWTGARIIAVAMDRTTGLPMPSSDTDGHDTGAMTDFATGWDDGSYAHGRPAAVALSPDGRLFVANDQNGVIFWIAPMP